MKVLYLLMLIAGLLWIGDFSITLKPFSVSLPCWYKSERLSMDAFKTQMSKVYSTSVCEGTLDESPMAYKNVQEIKELIEPTVEIIDTIVPLINIKAV